ncbi:MAG: Glycosyl transferase group 1 [Desulfonauticus sp. 38_4375]|jgi:glycosyltransferase involved in cell wall biosynthesis|nr:MAG: Glycosyl transferase group 1 [Desulfonauticus sp. 38_4375]
MDFSVVHLDLGKEYRGGQRQVFYLLSSQLERGIKVALAARKNSFLLLKVQEELPQVPVLALGGGEFNWLSAFKLASWIKKNNCTFLHTHEARAVGLSFWVKKLYPQIRLIHTRRVSYPFRNWWSKKKYTLAEAWVGVSKEICAYLKQQGLPASRIFSIPSALELKRYPLRQKELSSPVILGIIGALSSQKGHELVLPYLKHLPFAYRLLIVGEGELRPRLEAQVRLLGLEEQVRFLGFRESNKILPKLDVLLVPSKDGEGSSGTIKEAWASKVPVIASDLRANLELIEPGVNGLIFKLSQPETLVEELVKLIEDDDLYFRLTQTGFKEVLNFQVDKMEAKYFQLYTYLLAEG